MIELTYGAFTGFAHATLTQLASSSFAKAPLDFKGRFQLFEVSFLVLKLDFWFLLIGLIGCQLSLLFFFFGVEI